MPPVATSKTLRRFARRGRNRDACAVYLVMGHAAGDAEASAYYVGVSSNPRRRMLQHLGPDGALWRMLAVHPRAQVTAAWLPNRATAAWLERWLDDRLRYVSRYRRFNRTRPSDEALRGGGRIDVAAAKAAVPALISRPDDGLLFLPSHCTSPPRARSRWAEALSALRWVRRMAR